MYLRTLIRRAYTAREIQRAIDQTDVTIGLRKVAEHPPASGLQLFSEESYVVAVDQ